jgi:hypothetical protein
MTNQIERANLDQRLADAMDQAIDSQDAATRAKLAQARQAALAAASKPGILQFLGLHKTGASWALASLLTVSATVLLLRTPMDNQQLTQDEKQEMVGVLDGDEQELYEDYDFYLWLAGDGST